ncbi:MAG TPA: 6-carboxytetrahydropterin synthase, partial [Chitinophagaceae bacterium]|nr:6-carboxytetrahydropterin synthase [Chitinophagaceae bacterium]
MERKVAVFRKEHFNAAHRLHNPDWDDATNTEIFGKCNLPHYHGHNYELIVKITGIPDPQTGYV